MYSRLPTIWEKSKVAALKFVIHRVKRKMQGCKQNFLSQAGRETLIKAVVNAIPAYAMNCLKFFESICMELDALIARFFWGQHKDEGKVHWLAWQKVIKAKKDGGMGFHDFENFNDALLAKQVWRVYCCPNEMWAKQIKGMYFPNCSLFEAQKG